MLPLASTAAELAELRRALEELCRRDELAFAALFDPLEQRYMARLESTALADTLRAFDLIEGEEVVVGRHRIRRAGGRFYVLELGDGLEYLQDVWPETDALLAQLEGAAPGTLLDMGTGSGIVAVEAAARGQRAVATDLYQPALSLARWNARLNGLEEAIDFRLGHLFQPVAGERFDLVLTAPHYSRVCDQLRLETLHTGVGHVAPGGRLVVATQLEWEGAEGRLPVVDVVLAPLVARGVSVEVEPLLSPLKQGWFHVADSSPVIPGLVSRHRFLITLRPDGGRLAVRRPPPAAQKVVMHVPLERLRLGPPAADGRAAGAPGGHTRAVISTRADVARLRELLAAVDGGLVELDGVVPAGLLDGCRYGGYACISFKDMRQSAGAILDENGDVRPCHRGEPMGRHDTPFDELHARLRDRAGETYQRRGCVSCAALPVCSRCLFTAPLDEAEYCDLIRAEAARFGLLHRLVDTLSFVSRSGTLPPSLRLKLRPLATLIAARLRPEEIVVGPGETERIDDELVQHIAGRWRECETWLAHAGDRYALFWRRGKRLLGDEVPPELAELAELIGEGAGAAQLAAYRRRYHSRPAGPLLALLREMLGEEPHVPGAPDLEGLQ